MVLRRALFRWLLPAAVVLPLWMLVGWAIFSAHAGALVGVFFVIAPAILFGQLAVTLVIRMRPDVRSTRAVSWPDVFGVGLWHLVLIAMGCFPDRGFALLAVLAVAGFALVMWSSLRRLTRQVRGAFPVVPGSGPSAQPGSGGATGRRGRSVPGGPGPVIIVDENRPADDAA